MNVRLYVWQRGTAAVLLPLIIVHVAVIFYATRQNLTAADIFSRTHGSIAWGLFYAVFVVAASIHAVIGARNILIEWASLRERAAAIVSGLFGMLLLVLGFRAVYAVVIA